MRKHCLIVNVRFVTSSRYAGAIAWLDATVDTGGVHLLSRSTRSHIALPDFLLLRSTA